MNREIAILAGLIALAGSGSAQASHQVIYAPATKSSASSHAHQGPYVQASFMDVTNTTVNYTSTGPGGTATHGPLLATSSSVATTQPGGYADLSFGSSSSASADLATGRLKASVGAYGPEFYGSPLGFAESSLYDTLFFTNNSGGDVSLTFRYSFDGSVIDTLNASSPGGVATLQLSCDYWRCYNEANAAIRFAKSGTQVGDNIHAFFDENGISMFARNIYGDQYQLFDHFDVWNGSNGGSAIDGWMEATLLIPTGETSLGIYGRLALDCRGGSNCDFGHTGSFGFVGALPEGLAIGSASGVFLTANGTPTPGGIPEPASWALMILGFGAVGARLRRRLPAPAAA
ncbi:PEPxxWA-CTERM sorting domain-containing protein [Sandaracinobacteroides hominis]|uniref:PEPxxWA-CTERM sorting domain-containing protein n=1 Tax=Sandaracinobacteroides hominis TaxID=2780086 RepID=UPI001F1B0218|nr:PEPxxWA-CTERM sorting domain-containing protein [Sandaracinobacteroides hominis]